MWSRQTAFALGVVLITVLAAAVLTWRAPWDPAPGHEEISLQDGGAPSRLSAASSSKRRAPTPLLSQAYVDALKDILELEPEDVAALEQRLAADPEDETARLKLMAYASRGDRFHLPESRESRVEHTFWLIENHPQCEILGSSSVTFLPEHLTPEEYARARALWQRAAEVQPSDARVMWNAANFFLELDRDLYVNYLEPAVALDPENEHYGQALGSLYAEYIGRSDGPPQPRPGFAAHAAKRLDTTNSAPVVEAAVRQFQNMYNVSLMLDREEPRLGELAQRYLQRAEKLNPQLDRDWVYPQIEPHMIGMLVPGAGPTSVLREYTAAEARRLPVDDFPELPDSVSRALRDRDCLVPQTTPHGPPVNVIAGEFFEKGRRGWAALCSTGDYLTLLAFRDDSDSSPEEVVRFEDRAYGAWEGGSAVVCSLQIFAVGRDYIVQHYRAYGGPEPPPIDHQGIDYAVLEKASSVYYRHEGEWLRLTGAD